MYFCLLFAKKDHTVMLRISAQELINFLSFGVGALIQGWELNRGGTYIIASIVKVIHSSKI